MIFKIKGNRKVATVASFKKMFIQSQLITLRVLGFNDR